jgi:large subunit ribosomal protein L1
VSFAPEKLLANFRAVLDELQRVKPSSAKGRYVKSVAVSSTMGPGIDVDPARLRLTEDELVAAAASAS